MEEKNKLSEEEQKELFLQLQRIKESGEKSNNNIRERLILGNMDLALSYVERILKDKEVKVEIEDIKQIAMVVLINAVDNFNPNDVTNKGQKFSFPDYLDIAIQKEIAEQFNVKENSPKIEEGYEELRPEFLDSDRPKRYLEADVLEGVYVERESNKFISEEISTQDLAEYPVIVKEIVQSLYQLSEEVREVIFVRYGFRDGIYKSRRETAELLGYTEEQVRRLEERARRDVIKRPLISRKLYSIWNGDLSYISKIDKKVAIKIMQEIEREVKEELEKIEREFNKTNSESSKND